MIQIVNSPSGTLRYVVPHVFSTVVDGSVVPGITTSAITGTLFTPIYTEKGPTGVVKYFTGTQAAANLINTFGQPNTRKLGLPYTAAYEHAMAGGDVAVISVKHDSATNAGFVVNLVIESKDSASQKIEKTLGWILADGSGFVADSTANAASTNKPTPAHQLHKVESRRVYFEVVELKDINSSDELELKVKTDFKTEIDKTVPGDKRSFPLIWGLYKGKGNYGNNFQFQFNTTGQTVKGRPYFEMQVYDRRAQEFVPSTKQQVSLSSDRIDTEPLFITRKYQYPYNEDFYVNTLENYEFNKIGEIIEKELKAVNLFPNGATTAGAEAESLNARKEDLALDFALPEDEDYHRMSYFDPSDLGELKDFFVGEDLVSARFTGGSEGVLEEVAQKGFDWDMVFNTAPTGSPKKEEKVLQQIFVKAFIGGYTSNVFNLLTNPCDYVIDMGYPLEVKKAMASFGTKRDDVQILFNAPLRSNSISEALAFKQSFNVKGRNIYYFPGSFNYVDTRTDKSSRVPQTFAMMFNVLNHYQRQFSDPIAGMDNGVISGVEPNSGRGYGDMSLEENERLYKAGYNILSAHAEGLLYSDSQKSNYLLTEISSLQEFHNNSIVNRILKKLYLSLQYEKHRLNSADSVAKITYKIDNEIKSEFANKVKEVNYQGYFESTYAENIGLMQHRLEIRFFNTIKYHHIYIKALQSAS